MASPTINLMPIRSKAIAGLRRQQLRAEGGIGVHPQCRDRRFGKGRLGPGECRHRNRKGRTGKSQRPSSDPPMLHPARAFRADLTLSLECCNDSDRISNVIVMIADKKAVAVDFLGMGHGAVQAVIHHRQNGILGEIAADDGAGFKAQMAKARQHLAPAQPAIRAQDHRKAEPAAMASLALDAKQRVACHLARPKRAIRAPPRDQRRQLFHLLAPQRPGHF